MPRIDSVDIDEHILEKVRAKHGVSWWEIEEVCYSRRQAQREGRAGTLLVHGQTHGGRHLLVVLAAEEHSWMVVTARDMTAAEHRWFREARR